MLVNEITETTGHQYQERRMVEHLRGQLALIKGSELSAAAEMNTRGFDQKTEIHGYKLEITEKEMRAKQIHYEVRVMAEALSALEEATNGAQRQAKEEQQLLQLLQQQLKDANLALTGILWEQSPDWNRILPADDRRKFMIEGALLLAKVQGVPQEYITSWRHQSASGDCERLLQRRRTRRTTHCSPRL